VKEKYIPDELQYKKRKYVYVDDLYQLGVSVCSLANDPMMAAFGKKLCAKDFLTARDALDHLLALVKTEADE
jgi:hypothetical protein